MINYNKIIENTVKRLTIHVKNNNKKKHFKNTYSFYGKESQLNNLLKKLQESNKHIIKYQIV